MRDILPAYEKSPLHRLIIVVRGDTSLMHGIKEHLQREDSTFASAKSSSASVACVEDR